MIKRFTEIVSTQKVIDNLTNNEYHCLIDDELLELLNELDNEINTYHQGNLLLKKAMDELSKEFEKIELERNVYESFCNDVLKILRKYEINSLEKLDRVLMEQRVW